MKTLKIALSAAVLTVLSSSSLMGAEEEKKEKTYHNETLQKGVFSPDHSFEPRYYDDEGIDLGPGWILSGNLRVGWLQYNYNNPPGDATNGKPSDHENRDHFDSKGFYVIPKISITSPTWNGLTAKVTGAGATDFGLNDPAYETRTFVFAGSAPGSYAILQEAFIEYQQGGNRAAIGRQELTTPMIDADDWYMLANSFELAYYSNSMLENSTFTAVYFHKMAGVWDSGAYDANVASGGGTKFYSMSQATFASQEDKDNADDSGVATLAYQYKDENNNLQLWNYYATDLYNTLFAQYDFGYKMSGFAYILGAQYINWNEIGKLADNAKIDRAAGSAGRSIDASLYSVRFDGTFENGINFATGAAKYSDGDGFGTVLGAWGGYPYFANGMIFHFFEAGTLQNAASYKAQLGYDISDEMWLGARYTYWDLDPSKSFSDPATKTKPQDYMTMYGLRLTYSGVARSYFTFTYEFVDLDQQPDISSLRLIGGIKF
jgi:hypothetical protein